MAVGTENEQAHRLAGSDQMCEQLKTPGVGPLEIVEDQDTNTYRAVYTVKLRGAVYVLDAFQKKSKKGARTPQADIERINKRLNAAQEHYKQWSQENEHAKQQQAKKSRQSKNG